MPRKKSSALTDGELRLMRVLWHRGRATVGEVVDSLGGPPKPAYNTVLTVLRILERKGYLTHEKEGRAFVYEPIVDRRQARQIALRHLLGRFFDNSPEELLLNLFDGDTLDRRDVRRLHEMIDRAAQETS